MIRLTSKLVATAAAVLLSSSLAFAQGTAPAPKADTSPTVDAVKKTAPKKGPPAKTTRTPESIACSAELDAKGIHGKPRKAALAKCKAEKLKAKKN